MATTSHAKAKPSSSKPIPQTIQKTWQVPSSSGSGSYSVSESGGVFKCTCPDFDKRGKADGYQCKHIKLVLQDMPEVAASLKNRVEAPVAAKAPEKKGLAAIFSNKPKAEAPKSKSKSNKPVVILPDELNTAEEVMVSGKMIAKAVENKVKTATAMVMDYCWRWFANQYAHTGARPSTSTMVGNRAKFDFIQTSRIFVNAGKIENLERIGVNMDDWVKLSGVTINYEAIRSNGLEEKLQAAIESMNLPDAVQSEILLPKHELRKDFFESLDKVARDSLQDGEDLSDKIYQILKILEPVKQVKNPNIEVNGSTDSQRLASALEVILDSSIDVQDSGMEEAEDEE